MTEQAKQGPKRRLMVYGIAREEENSTLEYFTSLKEAEEVFRECVAEGGDPSQVFPTDVLQAVADRDALRELCGELAGALGRMVEQAEDARKREYTALWMDEDVKHRNGRHDADASSMNMEHNHMLEADIESASAALARAREMGVGQ